MVRSDIRDRAADARYASRVRASALPSGRDAYRRLPDYSEDLKKLVDENPGLVRPITLPHKTWEGRTVEGIEITTNVDNLRDGKPVFLQMGVHHAREWPSGEHTIEWAFELVNGYKSGDARARRLVQGVRTIVIPIVNPDGFNISREAGEAQGGGDGRGAPNPGEDNETANIVAHPFEYRRKNCRLPDGDSGNCAGPSAGVASTGVDPNRNYGAFWGGPGASGDFSNETYYGPGPFSEPESQNIRDLVSGRQVTTLITNHTFSDLVLRAPGLKSQGLAAGRGRDEGARRLDGRRERLPEHVRLAALRHDRHHRGLVVRRHRRLRLHVRDRLHRSEPDDERVHHRPLPPALRRDGQGVGGDHAAGRRGRPRRPRQPRGVLQGDGERPQPHPALGAGGQGARRAS